MSNEVCCDSHGSCGNPFFQMYDTVGFTVVQYIVFRYYLACQAILCLSACGVSGNNDKVKYLHTELVNTGIKGEACTA